MLAVSWQQPHPDRRSELVGLICEHAVDDRMSMGPATVCVATSPAHLFPHLSISHSGYRAGGRKSGRPIRIGETG